MKKKETMGYADLAKALGLKDNPVVNRYGNVQVPNKTRLDKTPYDIVLKNGAVTDIVTTTTTTTATRHYEVYKVEGCKVIVNYLETTITTTTATIKLQKQEEYTLKTYYKVTLATEENNDNSPAYLFFTDKVPYRSQLAKWFAGNIIDISDFSFQAESTKRHIYEVRNKLKIDGETVKLKHTYNVDGLATEITHDFYGDYQLYNLGCLTEYDLFKIYSKPQYIKGIYDTKSLNKKLKTLVKIGKVFSTLYYKHKKPNMWNKLHPKSEYVDEDPKYSWDAFEIEVHISKWLFTAVNPSLRKSKFFEWVLTDDVPELFITDCYDYIRQMPKGKRKYSHEGKDLRCIQRGDKYYMYVGGDENNKPICIQNYNEDKNYIDHTITSCNTFYKKVKVYEPSKEAGYYILRDAYIGSAKYTSADEKKIFEYHLNNDDENTSIFIKGDTTKIVKAVSDLYYYIKNNLNIKNDMIFIKIIQENDTYALDKLEVLNQMLYNKSMGIIPSTLYKHEEAAENMYYYEDEEIDEEDAASYLGNLSPLLEEDIILDEVNDLGLYKLHIRKQ